MSDNYDLFAEQLPPPQAIPTTPPPAPQLPVQTENASRIPKKREPLGLDELF